MILTLFSIFYLARAEEFIQSESPTSAMPPSMTPTPTMTTPHFDGKRFYNLNPIEEKNFWTFLKWRWSAETKPWPSNVSDNVPYLSQTVDGENEIVATFVNHATVLLQLKGLNILTDPIWSERASPVTWAGPKRARRPGVELDQLPPIDLVLISHNHYDHLDLATLEKLNNAFHPQFLVAKGDQKLLQTEGIQNVQELDWDQSIQVKDSQITFLPTQHWSGRGLLDRSKSLWGAYLIEHHGKKIYFGGDSGYANHYTQLKEKKGGIDLAFLPIGAYEPRWFMKDHHMNPADAVQAHRDLSSRQTIGIHFGTWQLTDEGIDDPEKELQEAKKGDTNLVSNFITLKHGQSHRVHVDRESQ